MLRRWLSSEQPIGCGLTARHVRLAQVIGWHSGSPAVTFQERALPAEAVDDAGRRNAALPKLIREMLKSGDFRGRAVVSALPPEDVWYRSMRLAPLRDDELSTAAHWVAAKELGLNAETFKTEAMRIGAVREADHEKAEVVAVGANLKALSDHAAVLTRAGLVPVAIDVAPCAAARMLTGHSGAGARPADETLLVIDISGRGTTIVVAGDGQVKFLRAVGGGLARVAELLAQRLAVPPRAAEELLSQPPGDGGDAQASLPGGVTGQVLRDGTADAWGMFGRELARDVSRSLDHYCELLGGTMPSAAVVIGEAVADEAFAEAFAELTGIGLRPASEVLPPAQAAAMGTAAGELGCRVVPAGLSIFHGGPEARGQALGGINLLPESYFAARRIRRLGWLSAAAGVVVLAAAGAAWWLSAAKLEALSAEIALVENKLAVQETQQAAAKRLEAERDALQGILGVRRKVDVPLPVSTALALPFNLVPPSIALTRASLELPRAAEAERTPAPRGGVADAPGAAAAQPMRLELEGLALSDLEVVRFVSTVSSHRLMRNVQLTKSRNVNVGGVNRVYFVVDLQIPLNGEFVPREQKGDRQ